MEDFESDPLVIKGGKFTLAEDKLLEKIRDFRFSSPWDLYLEFIASAYLMGAHEVVIGTTAGDVFLSHDGLLPEKEQLMKLGDYLFAEADQGAIEAFATCFAGVSGDFQNRAFLYLKQDDSDKESCYKFDFESFSLRPSEEQVNPFAQYKGEMAGKSCAILLQRRLFDKLTSRLSSFVQGLMTRLRRNTSEPLSLESFVKQSAAFSGLDIIIDGQPIALKDRVVAEVVEHFRGRYTGYIGKPPNPMWVDIVRKLNAHSLYGGTDEFALLGVGAIEGQEVITDCKLQHRGLFLAEDFMKDSFITEGVSVWVVPQLLQLDLSRKNIASKKLSTSLASKIRYYLNKLFGVVYSTSFLKNQVPQGLPSFNRLIRNRVFRKNCKIIVKANKQGEFQPTSLYELESMLEQCGELPYVTGEYNPPHRVGTYSARALKIRPLLGLANFLAERNTIRQSLEAFMENKRNKLIDFGEWGFHTDWLLYESRLDKAFNSPLKEIELKGFEVATHSDKAQILLARASRNESLRIYHKGHFLYEWQQSKLIPQGWSVAWNFFELEQLPVDSRTMELFSGSFLSFFIEGTFKGILELENDFLPLNEVVQLQPYLTVQQFETLCLDFSLKLFALYGARAKNTLKHCSLESLMLNESPMLRVTELTELSPFQKSFDCVVLNKKLRLLALKHIPNLLWPSIPLAPEELNGYKGLSYSEGDWEYDDDKKVSFVKARLDFGVGIRVLLVAEGYVVTSFTMTRNKARKHWPNCFIVKFHHQAYPDLSFLLDYEASTSKQKKERWLDSLVESRMRKRVVKEDHPGFAALGEECQVRFERAHVQSGGGIGYCFIYGSTLVQIPALYCGGIGGYFHLRNAGAIKGESFLVKGLTKAQLYWSLRKAYLPMVLTEKDKDGVAASLWWLCSQDSRFSSLYGLPSLVGLPSNGEELFRRFELQLPKSDIIQQTTVSDLGTNVDWSVCSSKPLGELMLKELEEWTGYYLKESQIPSEVVRKVFSFKERFFKNNRGRLASELLGSRELSTKNAVILIGDKIVYQTYLEYPGPWYDSYLEASFEEATRIL